MGQQRHFDRVRALIHGCNGTPMEQITLESRICDDLGVAGDDGYELLEAFADEFGIDISGVVHTNYFGNESMVQGCYSSLIPVAAAINPPFAEHVRHAVRGLRVLTVRDMVRSAREGRWIRPTVLEYPPDALLAWTWWDRIVLTGSVLLPLLFGLRKYLYFGDSAVSSAAAALVLLIVIWLWLGLNFLLMLRWLRRTEEAARIEDEFGVTDANAAD